jgi:hypothetical protein
LNLRRPSNKSVEGEAKVEKAPTTATYMFKVEFKFRPPQKMSYIARFERFEIGKAIRFYVFERGLAKRSMRFAVFAHGLQLDAIRSMVLASLVTALMVLVAILVMLLGVH